MLTFIVFFTITAFSMQYAYTYAPCENNPDSPRCEQKIDQ